MDLLRRDTAFRLRRVRWDPRELRCGFAVLLLGIWPLAATLRAEGLPRVSDLSFSDDGRFVAVLYENGNLTAYRTRSREAALFIPGQARGNRVAWRPHTHQLAAALDRGEGWDIWLLDVDTGAEERLTRHPGRDATPQWIAKGATLVFETYRNGSGDLFQMNMVDRVPVPLVEGEHDQWGPLAQPGGDAVAYLSLETELASLWVWEPDKPPCMVATLDSLGRFVESGDVCWGRDGRSLLYVEHLLNLDRLHAYDVREGQDRLLSEGPSIRRPAADEARRWFFYESPRGLVWNGWKTFPYVGRRDPEVLTLDGLALGRPALCARGRAPLMSAVAARGRIAALGRAPDGPFAALAADAESRLFLGETFANARRLEAALEAYARALRQSSDSGEAVEIRLRRAAALRRAGEYARALEEVERLAESPGMGDDKARIQAIEGEILLFEIGDAERARRAFESAIAASSQELPGAEEAFRVLSADDPALLDGYCSAHRALRQRDLKATLDAMRRMADAAPTSTLVRDAVLALLADPYRDESLDPAQGERFAAPEAQESIVRILTPLERASRNADAAGEADPAVDRLREALLQALLRTRRLAEARDAARRLIASRGPERFGAKDFLEHYLDTDGHSRVEHTLLAKVLVSPETAPSLEEHFKDDAAGRAMLCLVRIKSALLEGDFAETRRHLDEAQALFENLLSERFRPEIARLEACLHLFEGKYYEGQSLWSAAIEPYLRALSLVETYAPDRAGLYVDLDLARAEAALGETSGEQRRRMQAILRGMGDRLLNPVVDAEQLLMGARNLRSLARQEAGAQIRPFLLLHMGTILMQAGRPHSAARCFDLVLKHDLPDALRAAVFWRRASLSRIDSDAWLEHQACQGFLSVARKPFLEDAVRMRGVEPLLALGMEDRAKALLEELRESATVETVRDAAVRQLENLGEAAQGESQGE